MNSFFRWSLLAMLAGCATAIDGGVAPDKASDLDQVPPPGVNGITGDFDLYVTDLVPGEPAQFTVVGAPPGQPLFYVMSPNGVGSGPCPSFLQGACPTLATPRRVLFGGQQWADSNGMGSFDVASFPSRFPVGDCVTFEVFSPWVPQKSQPVERCIQPSPAACIEDRFYDNHSVEMAAVIPNDMTWDGLQACNGTSDFYAIEPRSG